jgi:hypothetical protein
MYSSHFIYSAVLYFIVLLFILLSTSLSYCTEQAVHQQYQSFLTVPVPELFYSNDVTIETAGTPAPAVLLHYFVNTGLYLQ